MSGFALIASYAEADNIVVKPDKLGFQYMRRQNHVIDCMRFLGNRGTGGR
jgi:hypothetical protein